MDAHSSRSLFPILVPVLNIPDHEGSFPPRLVGALQPQHRTSVVGWSHHPNQPEGGESMQAGSHRHIIGNGAHHFHPVFIDWKSGTWPYLTAEEVGKCIQLSSQEWEGIRWKAGSLCHMYIDISCLWSHLCLKSWFIPTTLWTILGMSLLLFHDICWMNARSPPSSIVQD